MTVVRLASQGYTYVAIARTLDPPCGLSSVETMARRAMAKLGAKTITHAVYLAYSRGLIGVYPDCGSNAAYLRHRRREEIRCPKCLLGKAQRDRARRAKGATGERTRA